jgi:hypothetical protein
VSAIRGDRNIAPYGIGLTDEGISIILLPLEGGIMVGKGRLAVLALFLLSALLSGCGQDVAITSTDVFDVLMATALIAKRHMPPGACVGPALAPSSVVWPKTRTPGEWSKAAGGAAYRRLPAPAGARLPDRAMALFKAGAAGGCAHPLVFHQPDFIEVGLPGGSYLEAIVEFDNPCPICGAGYQISFRKTAKSWDMEPPGLQLLWIS